MKTEIYYFSGTGNSLYIAKAVNESLIEPGDVFPITKYNEVPTVVINADVLGFVFPVYMETVPDVVENFITRIDLRSEPYIFAAITYNSHAHYILPLFNKLLNGRSMELSLGEVVNMPGNAIVSSPEENEKRLIASQQRIKDIASKVDKKAVEFLMPPILGKELSSVKERANAVLPNLRNKFQSTSLCTGCGTCVRVCPMANVELKNSLPEWGDHCAICLACFHWCPNNAIMWTAPVVGDRPQYHHPLVTAADIAEQCQPYK